MGSLRGAATAPIAAAEADALAQGKVQLAGLIQSQRQLQRALTQDISGQQRLQLETDLAQLGLSQDIVSSIISSQFPTAQLGTVSRGEQFGGIAQKLSLPGIGAGIIGSR